MKSLLPVVWLCALLFAPANSAVAQEESATARFAALKQLLAESQTKLKAYEWIETTVVSMKGEEKSRTQKRCYHGADGAVQKLPLTAPAEVKRKRGLRGRIAEKKKEELTGYMKDAVDLVKLYVPPEPVLIQAAKDAGKISLNLIEPGKRVHLDFQDYLKSGDVLGVEIDQTSNRILGINVNTYIESPEDAITLGVKCGVLEDGSSYVADVVLDAKAKLVKVRVSNTGYRRSK